MASTTAPRPSASSLSDAPGLTPAQAALIDLVRPESRARGAQELASRLGAEALVIFVEDTEVQVHLPAPGFPQTLPEGRRWHRLVREAVLRGTAQDALSLREGESAREAVAYAARDGSVLVLLGGAVVDELARQVVALLPLLARSLQSEQASIAAGGRAEAARTAATQAQALAEKLSATRQELQRALTDAEAAAQAKDDFLAVVSHELRTPLNAILGWVQLVRMGRLDEAATVRALESIERNAKSQARLIGDILDLSRIVSGRFRLDVAPLQLADVIENAMDVVRPAAEAKGIRLHSVLDSQPKPILGDGERLQQVVWNLLSNAITHTPRGGRIFVRLQRVNSHIELAVADTGAGISAQFLPNVFDRFSQADNSASRARGGLGLGLAITRHLVELHGGTIRAESEGEGRGATFTVSLPFSAVQAQRAVPTGLLVQEARASRIEPLQPRSLEGVRVLVVDDQADAREIVTTFLRHAGAVVTAVRSATEALETIAIADPAVIISDIEMPGEDGYALMRRIRAGEGRAASQAPAIALSAYAGPGDRMRALEAGFQVHVPKPVEPAELVALVANLAPR